MSCKYSILDINQGSDTTVNFTVYIPSDTVKNILAKKAAGQVLTTTEQTTLQNSLQSLVGSSAEFRISSVNDKGETTGKSLVNIVNTNGLSINTITSVVSVELRHAMSSPLQFIGGKFKGWYQLRLTFPNGTIQIISEGSISFPREIKL